MSPRLRRLLHRALDLQPDTRHPAGKPAGTRCGHLDAALRCDLFGSPQRPAVCGSLQPSEAMCGHSRDEALAHLQWLEAATR